MSRGRAPDPAKAVRLAEAEKWKADVQKLTWLDFEALIPRFNDMQVKELRRVVYRISVERGLGK
ncbi:MAG: hypothetical protein KGI38_12630, partial [Thaumarchaeota archaeon]|nr:hypothetical protein [Nitrososphaerota archaeon]